MKALERTLQEILFAPSQYVIPVFQRYYVWEEENWKQLWEGLTRLLEPPYEKHRHFMGSIACVPEPPMPGKFPAFQIIDGQQRLVTRSVLLCAMRDAAKARGWDLAAEIEENSLIHRLKKDRVRYKVYPRWWDRHLPPLATGP